MEHIRQSSQKHAAGTFNITEDTTSLRSVVHQVAILTLPVYDVPQKPVATVLIANGCNLKKDSPQLSGIARFRRGSAPGEPLSLNVNKASLDYNIRPEIAQRSNNLGVTIHRKAMRTQPFASKAAEEGLKLGYRTLRDRVLTGHNLVQISLHQCDKASRAVHKRTVQDKMLALGQANAGRWWRLFQKIVNHTIQLGRAVLALAANLPDGISFDNPAPEPFPPFGIFCRSIMPASGSLAGWTKPTLFSIRVKAISLENS